MADLKLVLAAARGQFTQAFEHKRQQVAHAATGAITDARDLAVRDGRAQIGSGGFGAKWQNTLRGNVYPSHGDSMNAATLVYHRIPYAGIFETGGQITGKPYLWLPLSQTPLKLGSQRMTPALFVANVAPLHFFRRANGLPLLAAYLVRPPTGTKRASVAQIRNGARAATREGIRSAFDAAGKQRLVSVPMFVGIPTVTLRKRFDLRPVFQRARASLGANFARRLASG